MTDHDRTPRPAVMVLAGLTTSFGVIGMAIGFASLLGLTATATGGHDTAGFGAATASAASSFALGLLLVVGAALLWRAHRGARVVIGSAVTLLALSSLARIVIDPVTFVSVVGTVLSLVALTVMGYLLASHEVRDHIRDGVPMRLR